MKMDHSPSLTLLLLLLLLGLSQANPSMEDGSEIDYHTDDYQIEDYHTDDYQIEDYHTDDYETDDHQTDDYETDNSEPGDIDITDQILSTNNGSSEMLWEGDVIAPMTRNAMTCFNRNCRWKKGRNGYVTVPYTISRAFSQNDMRKIDVGMKSFHGRSCIRFVKRTNQRDFISIENKSGCFSRIGRTGGRQVLSLSRSGCMHHGIIQHEINHALGFHHEQTRSDRDRHVKINWQYIQRGMASNFQKQRTDNLNTPYDYTSIMHYGKTAFSTRRGMNTIIPIPNANVKIGQRQDMSRIDIQRLKKLYKC